MAERSYVGGNFYFNLDGVKCGFVKKLEGGGVTAEVIQQNVGGLYFSKKTIGTPKYEDFSMQIGFSMSKNVYQWIADSWLMNHQRKNGSFVACDFNLNAKSEREFFNALIVETGLPACDGSSKEPAYMTVKFAPEYTRVKKASGKAVAELGKSEQKLWLPQNFRCTVDGMDCTKVAKIDALTIKCTAVTDDVGELRDYEKNPGKIEMPNVKFTFAEVTAQSWIDWHDDFVVKGNNGEEKEKTVTIEYISPNRQDVLLTVTGHNCGIFKCAPDAVEANNDGIKRWSAELYCERWELNPQKAVA